MKYYFSFLLVLKQADFALFEGADLIILYDTYNIYFSHKYMMLKKEKLA